MTLTEALPDPDLSWIEGSDLLWSQVSNGPPYLLTLQDIHWAGTRIFPESKEKQILKSSKKEPGHPLAWRR